MTGLVLEGGGSRGAYQIGVVKAYLEAGYKFDGFAGTSIGAINAAALAQGSFKRTEEMWRNMTTEQLFDDEISKLMKIGESKWDMRLLGDITSGLKKVFGEHGIDTSKIKAIIENVISEKRIRASGRDFGLVTVSVTEMRPYEMYLEDIPEGELLRYIMASSCIPGFKPVVIGKNTFTDGGIYNNCPVNMLIKKGYDEIIVVRTNAPGVYRRVKAPKDVTIRKITPKGDIGNILVFSPEKIEKNIEKGYLDGARAIEGNDTHGAV